MATETLSPTVDAEARGHLHSANPAVLTAVLATLTGEMDRARGFIADLSHGFERGGVVSYLPRDRMTELVDWYLEVESRGIVDPALSLTDEDFAALASGLVGWDVPASDADFYQEQAGFVNFVARTDYPDADVSAVTLLVIGAGMAGIAAAIAAREAGISCQVLERAERIGGVWQQNTYPGVGVDTPSAYYSFSFEVNDRWSGVYPTGTEYVDYLDRVVEKYDVRKDVTFGADVRRMEWRQDEAQWAVTYVKDGAEHVATATAVMAAAGYLTRPQFPAVPGLDDFEGTWFHSADWNHDYDFAGKRLAVVGTGCTSVQIVDSLVDQVDSLTLVQRQPHWVMPPAVDERFTKSESWLNANIPSYVTWARLLTFIPISDFNYPVVRYDEEWAATHDLSISPANDQVLQVALGHLESSFADRPDLVQMMKPSFAPFGKRPIRDPGNYYNALKKDTTTVVSGLARVVPEGFIDAEGALHEVDVIVYATGFTLEYLANIEIVGRDQRLSDVWGDSPVAYNGCQVPGFPNLFVTSGPHANPSHGGGHNFSVEAVVHYVIESLRALAARGARFVEPTPDAQVQWKRDVDERMADSVWARETRATTYYRNAKGEVVLASPLPMVEYWTRLRGPNPDHIEFGS